MVQTKTIEVVLGKLRGFTVFLNNDTDRVTYGIGCRKVKNDTLIKAVDDLKGLTDGVTLPDLDTVCDFTIIGISDKVFHIRCTVIELHGVLQTLYSEMNSGKGSYLTLEIADMLSAIIKRTNADIKTKEEKEKMNNENKTSKTLALSFGGTETSFTNGKDALAINFAAGKIDIGTALGLEGTYRQAGKVKTVLQDLKLAINITGDGYISTTGTDNNVVNLTLNTNLTIGNTESICGTFAKALDVLPDGVFTVITMGTDYVTLLVTPTLARKDEVLYKVRALVEYIATHSGMDINDLNDVLINSNQQTSKPVKKRVSTIKLIPTKPEATEPVSTMSNGQPGVTTDLPKYPHGIKSHLIEDAYEETVPEQVNTEEYIESVLWAAIDAIPGELHDVIMSRLGTVEGLKGPSYYDEARVIYGQLPLASKLSACRLITKELMHEVGSPEIVMLHELVNVLSKQS